MRVQGTDGRTYSLDLRGREVMGTDDRSRSGPHKKVSVMLKRLYPLEPLHQEVPLPGSGGLTADFFLSHQRVVVEIHGEQHFKYTPHFHRTRAGFLAALRNDARKAEWCYLNNIKLIVLKDTETEVEWQHQISGSEAPGDGA